MRRGLAWALLVQSPYWALPGFALVGAGYSSIIPLVFAAGGRIDKVSEGAGVATVSGIGYLGFLEEGSRQSDIYKRHCLGAGSTFSLYLKGGEKEAFAFLDALQIANLAVSLGGTETLASAPAAMTHLSVPEERKKQLDITPNLVRISIGCEDADDLIADFANALQAV